MENVLKIDNLNYKLNGRVLFENLSFEINKNDFFTIAIGNGKGKTTLAYILSGLIKSSNVYFKGFKFDTENKKTVSLVTDNELLNDTVEKNLLFTLNNIGIKEKKKRLDYVYNLLDIRDIKDANAMKLSMSEKAIVRFAQALIIEPELLIIDDAIGALNKSEKKKLYKLLRKLNKNMTIVNITSKIEYTKTICIIDKKVIECGKAKKVLSSEKIFSENNITTPFMAQLSNKLKYYELCDGIILSMNAMVDKLWK